MDEVVDVLRELVREIQDLNRTLERMDDGLFSLNLHVGADVSAWTGSGNPGMPSVGAGNPAESGGYRSTSQGVVKWYNRSNGTGFIAQTGGGPDVFVHVSVIPPPGFPLCVRLR